MKFPQVCDYNYMQPCSTAAK